MIQSPHKQARASARTLLPPLPAPRTGRPVELKCRRPGRARAVGRTPAAAPVEASTHHAPSLLAGSSLAEHRRTSLAPAEPQNLSGRPLGQPERQSTGDSHRRSCFPSGSRWAIRTPGQRSPRVRAEERRKSRQPEEALLRTDPAKARLRSLDGEGAPQNLAAARALERTLSAKPVAAQTPGSEPRGFGYRPEKGRPYRHRPWFP